MTYGRSRRAILAGIILAILVAAGAAGWWQRSEVIGLAARVYLAYVATVEERTGDLTRRGALLRKVHRALLLAPPPEPLIPELYEFLSVLSQEMASGRISLSWAAYLYTSHLRDAVTQRPSGHPRAARKDLDAEIAQAVEFFTLQGRPDRGSFGDRIEGESYTVEEIEAARRQGRDPSSASAADDVPR
jgi:hypothetical protein